jgi:HTH-type transcriptional regulator / antitoxin HigA
MSMRTPAEVFPPGEFIRDELEARGWTQGDLAQIMGRPEPAINLIINDKRGITPETAIELAGAFGTSPEFWLNLENAYKLSKVVVPFSEIRERASLFEAAPVKEMEKRGWIKTTNSIDNLKLELNSFYAGIDIENFKVAARASTDQGQVTPEQLAWCVKALQLATRIPARPYKPERIGECKNKLKSLAAFPEGVAHVPEVLAEFGIRFVVVEHLTGSKIDGAALWLGDGWDKPVVALSARYDRIDCFWHTTCHEISHIEHKDSIALIDVDLSGDEKRDESIFAIENRANREAADMLIPRDKLDSFIVRKRPYFSKLSIIQFANANRIHPGIVAGQLHHRLGTYKTNREMLVKIRDILTSRALTDGWGVQILK